MLKNVLRADAKALAFGQLSVAFSCSAQSAAWPTGRNRHACAASVPGGLICWVQRLSLANLGGGRRSFHGELQLRALFFTHRAPLVHQSAPRVALQGGSTQVPWNTRINGARARAPRRPPAAPQCRCGTNLHQANSRTPDVLCER